MQLNKNTSNNYIVRQLELSLKIGKLTDISDPVYTFCKIMDRIDLSRYFVVNGYKADHPRCDEHKLLKVILLAFIKHGISSLRDIERLCRNDIRYLYLLNGIKAPSSVTFGSFIRKELTGSVEQIFLDANTYIFQKNHVDLEHVYFDRAKIKADTSRYTWVRKKSCTKSHGKVSEKISMLFDAMDRGILGYLNLKLEERKEYAIDYVSELLELYRKGIELEESTFVFGCGHRESVYQEQYQKLQGYLKRLKTYARHIEVCGKERNSYSKMGHSATFIRLRRGYMGDGQSLPAYSLQIAARDEYTIAVDVKPYVSGMEYFVPLMEKFHKTYGRYPKYPVADVGYGSYSNYLYCEEHGMKKYMRSMMFQKETKGKKYHENPYRAVNFQRDESRNLLYPVGRKFRFECRRPIYKNQCRRTEEFYECESCKGCEYRSEYSPKAPDNRITHMNEELIAIHQEILSNLEPTREALLRINRSIQTEGTLGILKWDRSYKRPSRRGGKDVILELMLISYGFNIYKHHNKGQRKEAAAQRQREVTHMGLLSESFLTSGHQKVAIKTRNHQNRHLSELATPN